MRQKLYALLLIGTLLFLAGCSGTELQHGLTEQQANEVLVALQQNNISATKVKEAGEIPTWMISVSGSDAVKAWRIMQEHGLPRPLEKGMAETFGKDSLIPTQTEEKALYLQALCTELQKTIESIDGVVQARVHVVLPEEQIIPEPEEAGVENPNHPKAAVMIKFHRNSNGELPYKEESIRILVSNSIPKLNPKDVAVVGVEMGGSTYVPQQQQGGSQASLVWVGPIGIDAGSFNTFKIAGVGVAGLILIMGIGLLFSSRKSSSLQNEVNRLRSSRPDKLAKVG